MENLDATVIVTALPVMALEFGVPTTSASLGISAYLLAVAIFIPLSAWFADRFGTRTVLSVAIFMFTFVLLHLFWSFFIKSESLNEILDKDFSNFLKVEL